MPRYLIDTDDADLFVEGDESTMLDCPKKARAAALQVLGELAKDKLPDGDERVFRATVRDDQGQEVYVATLALAGEWRTPPPL